MSFNPLRIFFGAMGYALLGIALALTAVIVSKFFGRLAAHPIGELLIDMSTILAIPAALPLIRTPYGGVFDLNLVITLVAVIVCEWLLSVAKGRL